jgi:ABC-type glycerol-3-phosphate transport system substrate-binding protein
MEENMTRKRNVSLIAVVLAVSLAGCAAWKSGTVTHRVTASQHTFKEAVAAFQTAEIAEHDKGFVPNDLHLQMQTVIQKVALAGVDLDTALAANTGTPTLKIKLDNIYALLDAINTQGIVPISNPNTKAILGIALNQVKAIIDLALTQVQ